MVEQASSQFTIYTAEAAIPRYQRAWAWGTAALVVLLCGAVVGGLLSGVVFPRFMAGVPLAGGTVDGAVLLARQEAVNARLRERIAQLEQALGGDVCTPAALEALTLGPPRP